MGKFVSSTFVASTLLMLVLVLVFARLGYWQLSRAAEKVGMLSANEVAADRAPLNSLADGFKTDDLYRKVQLSGVFDFSHQFLLDNKIFNGQPGFEVLTPFYPKMADAAMQPVILVNRGWVAASSDRAILPVLSVPENMTNDILVSLAGILTTPSKGFALGEAIHQGQPDWPLIIQFIDYETIASKLDRMEIMRTVIVSSLNQPWNYTYNWQAVAHGPEKHYGYAFQWFAMLLAVLVFYVYLNFIKKHE